MFDHHLFWFVDLEHGRHVLHRTFKYILNTFVILQLTSAYLFLFMWGWIIIGPIPCKSTKPIMIMYGIYVFTQFIFGILGTVWYNMGRLECSESVPELTKMSLFEVVTFWLTCEWRFLVFCFLK